MIVRGDETLLVQGITGKQGISGLPECRSMAPG